MIVDTAVRARLLSLTPVTTLVNQRIFTEIFPQGVTLPAICVTRVSQVELMHLRGPIGIYTARVEVECRAASRADALDIDEAVQGDGLGSNATGLLGFKGDVGSPAFVFRAILPFAVRQGYDPEELRQYRIQREFMCQFEGTH